MSELKPCPNPTCSGKLTSVRCNECDNDDLYKKTTLPEKIETNNEAVISVSYDDLTKNIGENNYIITEKINQIIDYLKEKE